MARAILSVEGIEKVRKTLEQQTALRGQSKSTLHNYLRRIAKVVVLKARTIMAK